jgi:hypothetical protein
MENLQNNLLLYVSLYRQHADRMILRAAAPSSDCFWDHYVQIVCVVHLNRYNYGCSMGQLISYDIPIWSYFGSVTGIMTYLVWYCMTQEFGRAHELLNIANKDTKINYCNEELVQITLMMIMTNRKSPPFKIHFCVS